MSSIKSTLSQLCKAIDVAVNPGRLPDGDGSRQMGFVLLVFPFDGPEGQRCHYGSNASDRREIAALLREQAAYFEGMPDGQQGTA